MERTPAIMLQQKIIAFINSLKDDGISYIGISIAGNESHFLPDVKIDTMLLDGKPFTSQHYFPPTDIESTVILRTKEIQ